MVAVGTKLGPYEVLSSLGAGGMGEVYRARDTTLQREVAIKVLPEAFALDADRLARFTREAQLLASLNHPHIAAIYRFEQSAALRALVLELVDGPTLAERIARGPVPLEEALPIARQILDALEAAHGQGIIHRDLKPANVKLRSDGTVKVLDFGLAKALEPLTPGSADAAASPTITSPAMTRMGVILGTAAYMSPEQARAHAVDTRTDIWAFGCLLYEMLTGLRTFAGEDPTETIAAIVRAEPDWSKLPPQTPANIRRTLHRCLEKDKKRRLADVRDVRLDLEEPLAGQPDLAPAIRARRWGERLVWSVAVALLTIATVAAISWRRDAQNAAPSFEMTVEITTPPTTDPVSLAISPDGRKIVYVASANGTSQLWLRSLETGSVRPLRGSDGGAFPFWSPDSRSVAFFSAESIYRVDIDGGAPKVVAMAPVATGGTWNRDGIILFPPVPDAPLMRVSENGGDVIPAGTAVGVQPGGGQRFPHFLPDGQHFLFYGQESRSVFLGSLDKQPARRLFEADSAAIFAPPEHVLFVRERRLLAQRFDLARLETVGEPAALADGISVDWRGAPAVSASAIGSIAYRTGSVDQQRKLAWYDRSGTERRLAAEPDVWFPINPSLSPDGRSVALNRSVDGNTDIWILDLDRGSVRRFTTDPGPDIVPVWSPDGTRILYSKGSAKGTFGLSHKAISESGGETSLPVTSRAIALDWSHDGRTVLFRTNEPSNGRWSIWAVPATESGKPSPVVQSNFDQRTAQFSPDGRWIAYESNESGRFEIYVLPFPDRGDKTTVSTAGGSKPRWNRNGRELFYVAADGSLMAVPVRLPPAGQRIELGAAVSLFKTQMERTVQGGIAHTYVVSLDGQQFLMSTLVEQPASPITLILNRPSQ